MRPVVVLVKPPEQSRFNFGTFSLGVLAASVRDLAVIHILDATDLTLDATVDHIDALEPDWVGITTMALSSLSPATKLIKSLKPRVPQAWIIVGGHGASMLPRIPLEAGADAVVTGEGEVAFRRLMEKGIELDSPGVGQLIDGALRTAPKPPPIRPLDKLLPPARDLMPKPENQVHLMETSRGCPHDCRFCETTRFYGRRWRYHSPQRVADEVRHLVSDVGAWIIEITDDNFGASRRRVLQICERLTNQALPAVFLLSARADDLLARPELLPAMARARMLRISVGVETLSPKLARSAGKFIALDIYRELFNKMRNLGMFSVASFIVGLPGETSAERERTLRLALSAGPDSAQFVPFYPFPGVPLAEGYSGCDPSPDAIAAAARLTAEFYNADEVRNRLLRAAQGGDVRASLAQGTLEKYAVARC